MLSESLGHCVWWEGIGTWGKGLQNSSIQSKSLSKDHLGAGLSYKGCLEGKATEE